MTTEPSATPDEPIRGFVVFGDVVGSRAAGSESAAWLASLCRRLDVHYRGQTIASWEFTQGDEIQGLLALESDPLDAFLAASLTAGAPQMRWVIVAGEVEPGRGPATQRTGPAFLEARRAINDARQHRDGLDVRTGDERADRVLASIAPVLAELVDSLTKRQREVVGLIVVEGLSQADAAERLDVARATVSVSAARARVRSITRLATAVRQLIAEGAQVSRGSGSVAQ